jgi:hypothetical protein
LDRRHGEMKNGITDLNKKSYREQATWDTNGIKLCFKQTVMKELTGFNWLTTKKNNEYCKYIDESLISLNQENFHS